MLDCRELDGLLLLLLPIPFFLDRATPLAAPTFFTLQGYFRHSCPPHRTHLAHSPAGTQSKVPHTPIDSLIPLTSIHIAASATQLLASITTKLNQARFARRASYVIHGFLVGIHIALLGICLTHLEERIMLPISTTRAWSDITNTAITVSGTVFATVCIPLSAAATIITDP